MPKVSYLSENAERSPGEKSLCKSPHRSPFCQCDVTDKGESYDHLKYVNKICNIVKGKLKYNRLIKRTIWWWQCMLTS